MSGSFHTTLMQIMYMDHAGAVEICGCCYDTNLKSAIVTYYCSKVLCFVSNYLASSVFFLAFFFFIF